jgi:hypothetical protein
MWHKRGAGLNWNDQYTIETALDPPANISQFDFHEFTKLKKNNHTIALYDAQPTLLEEGTDQQVLAWDGGFVEFDASGKIVFLWRALDYIEIDESTEIRPESKDSKTAWDWL